MNYRHAFHAGNFADVMKHVLLTRILVHLARKDKPFRVIDTHAGTGFYDLASPEAERTGEWRDGIGRLDLPFAPEPEGLLAPYRGVIEAVRRRRGATIVPGSPLIVREMLRPQDRAVFVERHPEDGALLASRFNQVANTKVLTLDGWTALHGLVPPKERRGLVLIDPPYEEGDEFERLVGEVGRALARWPSGIVAAWYPIKDAGFIDSVADRLARAAPVPALRLELMVDAPTRTDRLNGSGLFVFNPPWTLAEEAEILLPAFAERLARGDYGGYRCERVGAAA